MSTSSDPALDVSEPRRRFDEACAVLRPELHRFCTRMTGNPWDGEDVLHDALALAFYRLAELRELGQLRGWLFRIAHNKCIDFSRGRRRLEPLPGDDDAHELGDGAPPLDDQLAGSERAARTVSNIVTRLPARERACVVLKDVLGCSLEETAEITGSNLGAVKAALHRGRGKLARAEQAPPAVLAPHHRALVERYLTAFNQRDWQGVRALLSDDALLQVVDRAESPFADAVYFVNHERLRWRWQLGLAMVDGSEAIVHYRELDGAWVPHAVVQLAIDGDRITRVRDYLHVDYLLAGADVTPATPGR